MGGPWHAHVGGVTLGDADRHQGLLAAGALEERARMFAELRQAEDRRGLAAAAVLGAAKRQLDRLPDKFQAEAEQARMALFRMGTG